MQRIFEIAVFILAWFAVIAQFILMVEKRESYTFEIIIRFFSFFTILTNLLVALFFTAEIFNPFKEKIKIFNQKGSLIAITAFIIVVGLVYQIVLKKNWSPIGFQKIIDEFLHSIIPLLVLLYWFLFSKKEKIKFSEVSFWLFNPLFYLFFVLIRGGFSNYFPYPFLNYPQIGVWTTILNCIIILILILVIMGSLIFINNKKLNTKNNFN